MWFLVKAAFWLGLVFLLLPDNSPQPAGRRLPAAGEVAAAVAEGAAALCRSHAEACARGTAAVAETVHRQAVRTLTGEAGNGPHDTLTPADLAVPFGGVPVPPGDAPRRAPLPPRRPV